MTDDPKPSEEATPAAPAGTPSPSTPLIYLDVDDEITSAAARIRSTSANRVALVLPYGSRLATSRINFRLLAREAGERGKQIEIICADASARALAAAAGLPVHPSVAAFEGRDSGSDAGGTTAATTSDAAAAGGAAVGAASGTTARAARDDADATRVIAVPRRSSPQIPRVGPPRPPVRTRLAVGIAIALIALIALGGFLAVDLLPSATIVLHPRAQELGPLPLSIEARADVTAPDPNNLVIPAQRITFQLQATQTFPATGTKLLETQATGQVTFSNFDTGGSNSVASGAIVQTPDGIEFATQAAVNLPAATIQFPFTIVPSTATVAVKAVAAGPNGNVNNNTITVVPKNKNRHLLQVTNQQATSGGASSQVQVVSAQDVDMAKAAMDAALGTDLDTQVANRTGVPVGLMLFPTTRAIGDTSYTTDPATFVDSQVATFDLSASAEATVIGVDPTPIQAVAEAQLRTKVAQGWSVVDNSITADIGTPSVAGEAVTFPVSVHGTQVHTVDQAGLIAQIKGLVIAQARAKLAVYGDVDISVWPDWVSTIPTHTDRITFTIGDPQASPTPGP